MTDTELMAILKVAADTVGKDVGERSTVIVIVHRPEKMWACKLSSEKGSEDLTSVSRTVASVAHRLVGIANGETNPDWVMRVVGPRP